MLTTRGTTPTSPVDTPRARNPADLLLQLESPETSVKAFTTRESPAEQVEGRSFSENMQKPAELLASKETWERPGHLEGYPALDVTLLKRDGYLSPGEPPRLLGWGDGNGGLLGAVHVVAGHHAIDVLGHLGLVANFRTSVRLDRTRCTTGGTRPYLLCPQCAHRRLRLYIAGDELQCRVCLGVPYTMATLGRLERLQEQRRRARLRVGQTIYGVPQDPPKPRYMRWEKWERLLAELAEADRAVVSYVLSHR